LALWTAASLLGLFSFLSLKLALFPDIAFPVVVVTASTSQIDPLVNERTVTVPLETKLKAIHGLTHIHSLTYPEYVVVDMNFDVGTPLETRSAQVAAAIKAANLPTGTTTNAVPVDLNETAVVTYALTETRSARGTLARSLAELAKIAATDVVPPLKAIPGVLKVEVIGGQQTGADASAYRYDGQPAVAVAVIKQGTANALDVAEASNDVLYGLGGKLDGAKLTLASSQATYIREASRATQEALGLAMLLAILVILPFLRNIRATGISALAIPTSLLCTVIVMRLFHFNLETITLLALALVVGVIVDDAIVAVEAIVRRIEDGEEPRSAAFAANKEIGRPMVATTLTIVAVFLPIGLMTGTLGQFFKPFGITASAAVLFSLLVARTLSPALAASWLRAKQKRGTEPAGSGVPRHPHYRAVLTWALRHRAVVVLIAIAAFGAGLALIPVIPKGFIPHLDRGEFIVTFQTPLGTPMEDNIRAAAELEKAVRTDPNVSDTYTTIGGRKGQPNLGTIDVHLRADRNGRTIDAENAVRASLPQLDGVATSVGDVPFVGTDAIKPLQFAIVGDNLEQLRVVGRTFEHRLQQIPGFTDVTATGVSEGTPFSAVEHVGGKRAVQISSDLTAGLRLGDAADSISNESRKVLPKGISLVFGGNSADVLVTFRDFGITLILSVIAIVVVLLVLFRSWLDPLVISVSLPLSIVGALFALWVTHGEFGLISLMGVIFLLGLVNKNAILLVDSIKRHRLAGEDRSEAILDAGAQRLRPILMTTCATILGMMPIALGYGAGAELRAPMAVAIIGGLITSTLLSLIVVPVAYTLVDDLGRRAAKRKPDRVS
jgi:multidrug efflux pump subunit AcrB